MDEIDMDLDLGDPMPITEDIAVDDSHLSQHHESQQAELDAANAVPNKIHIRGLDDLTTDTITSFALEYFPSHQAKLEWIDDTSANICYESPEIAMEALSHLTMLSENTSTSPNPLQLRATKPLSAHPSSALQVRIAVSTDRKRPRAHEASRFYMLHPELDPREQRRRSGSRDYRRRRYSDQEHRRRGRRDERAGHVASMYDDDDQALANRNTRNARRASHSSFSSALSDENTASRSYRPRPRRRSRSPSRSRSRSASPSRSPRRRARRRSPFRSHNVGKELFGGKASASLGGKELFPNKIVASSLKKELFPLRTGSDRPGILAVDPASETADLFASRMAVPFVDGSDDGAFPLRSDGLAGAKKGLSIKGTAGFSIRGAAGPAEDPPRELFPAKAGFSIRGAASTSASDGMRELFPTKVGNRGKELFVERKKNKADMYY